MSGTPLPPPEAVPAPAAGVLAPLSDTRRVLVVFAGLMLGLLMVGLDQTTVSVAAPTIAEKLGGLDNLSWVFTANLVAAAVAAPLFGKLSDRFGRRLLFNTAVVLFVAGSAACGLAQNMTALVVFRAVQGLGAGGVTAMAVVVVGGLVAPRARAGYQGWIGAELALAQVVGPTVGGWLTDHLSWRWVFFVNLPVGLAALAVTAVAMRLPETKGPRSAVDWPGAGLLVAWLSCLMLMLSWGGQQYPWSSGRVVALGVATALLLAAFLVVEWRAADPVLPLRLFRTPVAGVSLGLMFLAGAGVYSILFYLPTLLQIVVGTSATDSGLLMFPLQAGVVATSVATGHLVAATGRYRWWPVVGTALAVVGLVLLSRVGPGTGHGVAVVYLVVVGLGLGCVVQLMVAITQNAVPLPELGIATAATGLSRIVGGAVGAGVLGTVLNNRLADGVAAHLPKNALPPGLPPTALLQNPSMAKRMPPPVRDALAQAFADAFHTVFLAAAGITAGAFLLSLAVRQIPMRAREEPPAAADTGAGGTPVAPAP